MALTLDADKLRAMVTLAVGSSATGKDFAMAARLWAAMRDVALEAAAQEVYDYAVRGGCAGEPATAMESVAVIRELKGTP